MTTAEATEYHRTWRTKNKEHLHQYQEANKEKRKEQNRKRYASHRDEMKEDAKRWRQNNKEKCRQTNWNSRLKMTYGITSDEYNKVLAEQNGCCAICGNPNAEYKRRLHIDHNHSTGKIRGLLCVRCNSGLGNFQENLLLLDKAKEYICKNNVL